jgi:hypothetical protein
LGETDQTLLQDNLLHIKKSDDFSLNIFKSESIENKYIASMQYKRLHLTIFAAQSLLIRRLGANKKA